MSENNLLDEFIKATEEIRMLGIVVLGDGEEVARHMWVKEERTQQFSVTKSFTAAAIGIAVSEGLLAIDDPVKPYLLEDWPSEDEVDRVSLARLEKITLRHLITMTHGHGKALLMGPGREAIPKEEWVSHVLRQPIAYEPGERFIYNNAGPYLAGVVLQNAVQMSLVDYLMPRLFDPMGIPEPEWETDGKGRNFGASGMMLTLTEMAKFGQLYLQNGQWKGQQLIPKSWVEASSKDQVEGTNASYGLGFWVGPGNTYRADGKYSQYILMAPDKKAVVAITAWNDTGIGLLDLIIGHIIHHL